MADIKSLKHTVTNLSDFDPFTWACTSCGKTKVYTEEEIDKTKIPYPDPQNHDYDFYISCPFCKTGVMEPPAFVSFF
jgi:hypothetical protein